jgi:integrase
MAARTITGIRARHSRSCKSASGGACICKLSWEASVYLKREGRKVRKTFPMQAAAKAWRADAEGAKNRGKLRGPTATTVREAAEEFVAGARAGTIFTGGRRGRYKPATLRSYDRALRLYVLPVLAHMKLSEVQRDDVERLLVEPLQGQGKAASSVHNALDSLRCVYRRAIRQGIVAVDPCAGLELEKAAEREIRIPSPAEAGALLDALPDEQRALWATAAYAGLRHGELRALRVSDIDLGDDGVRRGWDDVEGEQPPKSEKSKRDVVLLDPLAPILRAHLVRTGRRGSDLVFGETAETPFPGTSTRRRAQSAWRAENRRRESRDEPPLQPLGFHDLRHVFASVLIASGANRRRCRSRWSTRRSARRSTRTRTSCPAARKTCAPRRTPTWRARASAPPVRGALSEHHPPVRRGDTYSSIRIASMGMSYSGRSLRHIASSGVSLVMNTSAAR